MAVLTGEILRMRARWALMSSTTLKLAISVGLVNRPASRDLPRYSTACSTHRARNRCFCVASIRSSPSSALTAGVFALETEFLFFEE